MGFDMHEEVRLLSELVAEIDRLVGKRMRGVFIEEAVREKLYREEQGTSLDALVGAIDRSEHKEWETPEKTSAWVRGIRRGGMERSQEEL